LRIHDRLELEGTEPGSSTVIDGTLLPARRCSEHLANLVIKRILKGLEERIDALDGLGPFVALVEDIERLGID
jgi:hypothetical protein